MLHEWVSRNSAMDVENVVQLFSTSLETLEFARDTRLRPIITIPCIINGGTAVRTFLLQMSMLLCYSLFRTVLSIVLEAKSRFAEL